MIEEVVTYEPYFTEEERINGVGFHTPEEYSKIADKRAQEDKDRHLLRYLKAKEVMKDLKVGDRATWLPCWGGDGVVGEIIGLNQDKLVVKLKYMRTDIYPIQYHIDWMPANEIQKR